MATSCPPGSSALACGHCRLLRGASGGYLVRLGALCPGKHAGLWMGGAGVGDSALGLGRRPAPHSALQPNGTGQQAPPLGLMELASISQHWGGGGCNRKLPSLAAIFSTAERAEAQLTPSQCLCPRRLTACTRSGPEAPGQAEQGSGPHPAPAELPSLSGPGPLMLGGS